MVLMDYGVSRRFAVLALSLLAVIYLVRLMPREAMVNRTKAMLGPSGTAAAADRPDASPDDGAPAPFRIRDKVAVISDTQFSARTVPLILHFHAVLGPAWPIVFYTSSATAETHLRHADGTNANTTSAVWRRAVDAGAIEVRTIPDAFDLTSRRGVNVFLSRPWLWEQLAPAKHVLVFQTDAMLCANAHRTVDDFLAWDYIAAPMHVSAHLYNGGLSLRNRTLLLDILADPANNWEAETAAGTWTLGGEDIWFSRKMDLRGAHLPDFATAITFACQHTWHTSKSKEPLGYHKVHKNMDAAHIAEIAEWCPEIGLSAPGTLAQHE